MKVYKWSSDCKVINGFTRSAIYDLTRSEVFFVDRDVSKLITKIDGIAIDQVELSESEIQWLEIFQKKEFVIEIPQSTFENFIEIEEIWDNPQIITNAVISGRNNFSEVNKVLYDLNCKHVLIYFEDDHHLERILHLHFKRTNYYSVDLLLKKTNKTFEDFVSLKNEYKSLNLILIEDETFKKKEGSNKDIRKVQSPLLEDLHKPTLHFSNDTFYESKSHNVYFNRKLFINDGGLVSLYGQTSFQTSLRNAHILISSKDETDKWFSTKDSTAICSDCELRRMCIDQRTPIKSEDRWYYQSECEYNPYISKWSNDDGYLTLEDVGVAKRKGKVQIDREKLEKILAQVWDEEV